ncbi:adenosylcobyric acid synthase (glutamine-hydrolysing) [Candidatus Methanoperedens nitroreducens]|uniref:Probable cobyric acid synthase n=1 Tax=Candidatus Methanoperedens nitratireducens TaxID=1392998 RepID=A0A062V6D7_9EURY|nr:cobyric acid synthase [Candidatus Methanoperedens nitroreducens]KCZ71349.1 adenosylcobyric acid synthase (glutamine-hydrolysing) [Candidatus Methanoperedens nitroreducens]MDJ1420978.1 cobyric acid synthase [Candidatus Methanoperedens sp.]
MAKNLMVIGTSSHVGKSVLVTALCRSLSKRYSVAPFKAQNMSLNSWITRSGEEIGIAQAIQAKAAGIEPTADMNPVLLKPKGNNISQIIILGRPYKDKRAGDYYDSTDEMMSIAAGAYKRLASEHDVIIIEGAGGAAEINLYHRDIVNIGIARAVSPHIILIGDIERGGVFASIYGTLQLLPEDIRCRVFGLIINKFRGDMGLLEPGIKQLEELTGLPVLGVIPYMDIKIPSEDSVSIQDRVPNNHPVRIAVIRLPHISNFTDLEPLERYADIRYIEPAGDPGEPDAIILPGTKNTVDDLEELRSKGMDKKIIAEMKKGIPIIGICGGYQMLGKEITDSGIEGTCGAVSIKGLGLLDVSTRFLDYKKQTRQAEKLVTGDGCILGPIRGEKVRGYEIHMGRTEGGEPAFEDDGCVSENGLVIGTYLHGLFENENIRNSFLGYLYKRRGITYTCGKHGDSIEELSGFIENHVNMRLIYRILEGQ